MPNLKNICEKTFTVLIIFACILIVLSSCSNSSPSSDSDVYKVEVGAVTNSTYNYALTRISNWSALTYAKISSLKFYLYNNTISDYGIQTGVTMAEIRDFLLSHGMSNYETSNVISDLQSIGNYILFANHSTDSSKKAWIYITK